MIKHKRKYVITGAAAIGEEFGRSAITIRRWIKSGPLKGVAYKPNKNSSPWTMRITDIDRLRQQMQGAA